MKKQYYLLLSAVIALNLIACKNNSMKNTDNPTPTEESQTDDQSKTDSANIVTENDNSESVTDISYEFLYDDDYWTMYDMTNAYYKSKEDYEKDVLKFIDEISTLLQCEDWYKKYGKEKMYIKLIVKDTDIGGKNIPPYDYTMNSSIFSLIFNVNTFQSNIPLAHELTHVITTKKTNTSFFALSLAEGICDYAADYLGRDITNSSRGLDCNALLQHMGYYFVENTILTDDEMKEIRATVGKKEFSYPYDFSSPKNYYWFIASDSFTEYLINTYGAETVMTIFNADDESIYNNYHENGLEGFVDEWNQFLNDNTWELTDVELEHANNYLQKYIVK